jgi:uncharacterized membrane protein YdcZ (DUF606 family)
MDISFNFNPPFLFLVPGTVLGFIFIFLNIFTPPRLFFLEFCR